MKDRSINLYCNNEIINMNIKFLGMKNEIINLSELIKIKSEESSKIRQENINLKDKCDLIQKQIHDKENALKNEDLIQMENLIQQDEEINRLKLEYTKIKEENISLAKKYEKYDVKDTFEMENNKSIRLKQSIAMKKHSPKLMDLIEIKTRISSEIHSKRQIEKFIEARDEKIKKQNIQILKFVQKVEKNN